jgi:hypothetical protein
MSIVYVDLGCEPGEVDYHLTLAMFLFLGLGVQTFIYLFLCDCGSIMWLCTFVLPIRLLLCPTMSFEIVFTMDFGLLRLS